MSRKLTCVLVLLTACGSQLVHEARAESISNLGEPITGFTQVFNTHWVAQPFTLDNANYNLNSATLGMTTATSAGGNFVVQIRDDAAGSPGSTVLATLSGNSDPFAGGLQTYSGSVLLSANQTYYVVAGVTAGGANYSWNGGFSDNQTGTLAWNIGDQQFSSPGTAGVVWSFSSTIANLISLDATPVPEPGTLSIAMIGLACAGTFAAYRRRRNSTI